MFKFDIECNYCGNRWKEIFYYQPQELECKYCKDKNLKLTPCDESKSDAFGYNTDTRHKDSYIK